MFAVILVTDATARLRRESIAITGNASAAMETRRRARILRRREVGEAAVRGLYNLHQAVAVVAEARAHAKSSELERRWGGRTGTPNIVRGRSTWIRDYLQSNPTYTERLFRRRFAVPLFVFWHINDGLVQLD